MSLAEVKKALEELSLSDGARDAVSAILSAADARGGMTAEEREKLLQILDVEDGLADIEISVAEEAIQSLDRLEREVEEEIASLKDGAQ